VLHYRPEDLGLRRFYSSGGLKEDDVTTLLAALRSAEVVTDLGVLGKELDLGPRRVVRALNALLDVGAAERRGGDVAAVGATPAPAVLAEVRERAEARQRVERTRVEMMRGYAETTGCRRAFLLGYFGEQHAGECGACDVCLTGNGSEGRRVQDPDDEFAPQVDVVHDEWGEGTVMSTEDDRITVFFPDHGYRTLARDVIAEKGLLEARSSGADSPG
jgi:ATP-dependent DNA helicase RecQ